MLFIITYWYQRPEQKDNRNRGHLKENYSPTYTIVAYCTILKQVKTFHYLESIITSDGRCDFESKKKIAQAKAAFYNMNINILLDMRKRILQCYVEPVLL